MAGEQFVRQHLCQTRFSEQISNRFQKTFVLEKNMFYNYFASSYLHPKENLTEGRSTELRPDQNVGSAFLELGKQDSSTIWRRRRLCNLRRRCGENFLSDSDTRAFCAKGAERICFKNFEKIGRPLLQRSLFRLWACF